MVHLPAAIGGQAALDLGASGPFRYLTFSRWNGGKQFIDLFAGHVFEIRQDFVASRLCWRASLRRQDTKLAHLRRYFLTCREAEDFLQAEAAKLGGGQ